MKKLFALFIIFFLASSVLNAELLSNQSGFYLDLPAGFILKDGDAKTKFVFSDPNQGMDINLIVYDSDKYNSSEDIARDVLKKLGSKGDLNTFKYQNYDGVVTDLEFAPDGNTYKGYAFFIHSPKAEEKQSGLKLKKSQSYLNLAFLAYTEKRNFDTYVDFILSSIDSFALDDSALRAPGPISQFLLSWPTQKNEEKKVKILNNKEISIAWNSKELDNENEIVTREYKILTAYQRDEINWIDAWERFYRVIYRDSAPRLDRLIFELSKELIGKDNAEKAKQILNWIQGFVYKRDENGTDFFAPLKITTEQRGDCDSRIVFASAILARMGIESILLVSAVYSHALIGIDIPGTGIRFNFNKKDYLVGETTDRVELGKMPKDMADRSNWIIFKPTY